MKTQKQWWGWALAVAGLGVHAANTAGANAQDAQVVRRRANSAILRTRRMPARKILQDAWPGLNFMEGSVSFQPGGENDWVAAELNRPLVTGDNLWADEDSRAELHIGSTALRLGPQDRDYIARSE